MLLDLVEDYLIGQGYRDIIKLRSNPLKEETPTGDTQTNIRVICSKKLGVIPVICSTDSE